MDIDNAANILAGSILTGLAILVAVVLIVLINNILHRFWKPLGWFSSWHSTEPKRFATEEEMKTIDKTVDPALK
jgi:hypothetical protein